VTSNGRNASRAAARELVERLTLRWPNNKKDAAQIVMYREDIGALVEECGLSRVQAAVEAARTRCSFLPEPAELRDLMPSPEKISSQPQRHDPNCHHCGGNGWKMILTIDNRRGRAERAVIRCACKAPATPKPAPRPNPEQCRAFVEEALRSVKTLDAAPRVAPPQAQKKPCSREVGELILAVVLTREQMDARRAAEHAEIVEAAQAG
jgi:hypothetical protein